MALTERTRPHQILIDFPNAESYMIRYREVVEILRGQDVINQSVSEPGVVVPAGEEIPEALSAVFGDVAADMILGSQQAADAHEARLQELADLRTRAEAAEQLAADNARRAEQAEIRLKAVQDAVSGAPAAPAAPAAP